MKTDCEEWRDAVRNNSDNVMENSLEKAIGSADTSGTDKDFESSAEGQSSSDVAQAEYVGGGGGGLDAVKFAEDVSRWKRKDMKIHCPLRSFAKRNDARL